MKPVSPVIPGVEETKIAEHQEEYETLPAIVTGDGVVISRWRLSFRERLVAMINGDIYLHQSTYGQTVQPVYMEVDEPRIRVNFTEARNA